MATLALGIRAAASSDDTKASFRDTLRGFNRRWFNPLVLRFAGRPPWPVARLEHRGRYTGALRATPLLAWPVAGGFIMPMPYGTGVDWAQNLRHARTGILRYHGVRYHVDNPRVIPASDAAGDLPFPIRQLAGVAFGRHLMRVDVPAGPTPEVSLPI